MKSRVNTYFLDIFFLLTVVVVAIIFWIVWMFRDYAIYFLLFLQIWVISLFLRNMVIKKSSREVLNMALFDKENSKKSLFAIKWILLINRQYIFPIVLVIYLIVLLVFQTHLRGLHKNILILLLNIYQWNILLWLVIVSGIATLFQQNQQQKYYIKTESLLHGKITIGLSVVLSLLGLYIIFLQTQSLGDISYLISIIAGILIFLIGVMITEEK